MNISPRWGEATKRLLHFEVEIGSLLNAFLGTGSERAPKIGFSSFLLS
jgi:hypothetical protein